MRQHHLVITWGTSRGRDTYGYTTAVLRENGEKKAACSGGGYDMRGTVFADWLQNAYQDRLIELAKAGKFKRIVWNGKMADGESAYDYPDSGKREELYGGNFYENGGRVWAGEAKNRKQFPPRVTLDGGCGFSSITKIAEACGLAVVTIDAGKKSDVILVTDTRKELVKVDARKGAMVLG